MLYYNHVKCYHPRIVSKILLSILVKSLMKKFVNNKCRLALIDLNNFNLIGNLLSFFQVKSSRQIRYIFDRFWQFDQLPIWILETAYGEA